MKQPRLPGNQHRTVEVGRTGTGKTVAGLWHLSNYDLNKPWIVFNFKDDEHIESIENTRPIDFSYVPKKKDSGLFVVNVAPEDCKGTRNEASPLEKYFKQIWARQNVGVFIDEAYPIGNNNGFELLLTQGRSRRIPMIVCTQRPCWISRFTFSEATFIQVFDLNDERDIQTVEGFMPFNWDDVEPLGPHQSFYYDVNNNELFRLQPTPDMDAIRERFAGKLRRQRVLI